MAILYRAAGFDAALTLVNDSPYGLTAAIHTASIHRAMRFAEVARAGVLVVNGGTHGSEPHMGFGGVKQSGTGWKEAGTGGARRLFRRRLRERRLPPGQGVSRTSPCSGPVASEACSPSAWRSPAIA